MRDKLLQLIRPKKWFCVALFVFLLNCSLTYSLQDDTTITLHVDRDLFEVESHNIKIDISSITDISVAERYTVLNTHNTSLSSIEIWINQSISNLFVQDFNGSLAFDDMEISESSHLLEITFSSELQNETSTIFEISYNLDRAPIPEHGNSHYFFEFYTSVTYFTREQVVEVKIPERSFIHEEEGVTPYFPLDGFALAGKRVYLSWIFTDLDPDEQTFIYVRFDKPLRETPVVAIVLGILGGGILGVGATILYMKRREKKVVQKISTIYLSDTQKQLLKLISESDGKILQKDLCIETGYTKSRISRNIVPLVEQGLIERDKWGKNYVIRLTENGRKVVE